MVVTGIDAWNTMRTNYQNDVLILQTKELERDAAQSKVEEIKVKQKELECLARNIYWEAANESYEGKLAVAQVTLNRTKASGYPNTVCEVVYQKMEYLMVMLPANSPGPVMLIQQPGKSTHIPGKRHTILPKRY